MALKREEILQRLADANRTWWVKTVPPHQIVDALPGSMAPYTSDPTWARIPRKEVASAFGIPRPGDFADDTEECEAVNDRKFKRSRPAKPAAKGKDEPATEAPPAAQTAPK